MSQIEQHLLMTQAAKLVEFPAEGCDDAHEVLQQLVVDAFVVLLVIEYNDVTSVLVEENLEVFVPESREAVFCCDGDCVEFFRSWRRGSF